MVSIAVWFFSGLLLGLLTGKGHRVYERRTWSKKLTNTLKMVRGE